MKLNISPQATDRRVVLRSHFSRYLVAKEINVRQYDKIMWLDCDSVAVRNLDHLLDGDWDIAVYPERGSRVRERWYGGYLSAKELFNLETEGLNSGTWAIRASLFQRFAEACLTVAKQPLPEGCLAEQSTFNRVLCDFRGRVHKWPASEIALPLIFPDAFREPWFANATVVHAAGGHLIDDKLRFLFSVFAGTYLFDPQLALFNILEM